MLSTEQKLKLVHFLREDNQKNRTQLHKREQVLYGKEIPETFYGEDDMAFSHTNTGLNSKEKGISGFRLRFMIAVILFLSFFYLDRTNEKVGKIDKNSIENYMEDDTLSILVSNVFDFNP